MSKVKPRRDGLALEEAEAAETGSVAGEGLDDDLLRQCRRLLTDEAAGTLASQRGWASAHGRLARESLLVARLAFEVGLLDRAEAETSLAIEASSGGEASLRLLAAIHHRRGRLSEAIALWEQLAARSAGAPSALRELGLLFERSLSEASPVSPVPSVPPALEALRGALPDLELSFRLVMAQNLGAALRAVERVAAMAPANDRHLLKVAAIQRAFILERTQDVQGAIAVLERLADVPGLASDVERLLCLSALYEREGTPERVRRAIRAVRYAYLSTREPWLLRRLARLLGRLGHERLAALFEARYLELFLDRRHALAPPAIARALSLRHVPIDRLSGLLALQDRKAAETLLDRRRRRRRPEHRRTAAALALLLGDAALARALFTELARTDQATSADLLYLAELEETLDEGARAREHGLPSLRRTEPRALVLAAAALRRGGEVHGLIHELWVETWRTTGGGGFGPADVLGAVSADLRAYAVNVFHSVFAYARARHPHRVPDLGEVHLVLKFTKEDEPSSGDSAGLPMAVAFLSALLDRPVPPEVAFSGAVVSDAHDVLVIRRVGDLDAKVEGAFDRRLRRLFLPEENRPDVEHAERVPSAVAAHLVRYVRTMDDVCNALFPDPA